MPREIITLQVGQCGNQSEYLSIGPKLRYEGSTCRTSLYVHCFEIPSTLKFSHIDRNSNFSVEKIQTGSEDLVHKKKYVLVQHALFALASEI